MPDSKCATARIWGALDLRTSDGQCLLPGGIKERAILTTLLVAPGYRRSRRWLQALLWSDSAPQKSSANLRQSLARLRKALAGIDTLLGADHHSVWLNGDLLDIANRSLHLETLFEGMDVGEEAYEDWLRETREAMENSPPEVVNLTGKGGRSRDERTLITLVRQFGITPFDSELQQVTVALRNRLTALEVFDLREAQGPVQLQEGLALSVSRTKQRRLRVTLLDVCSDQMLWSLTHDYTGKGLTAAGSLIERSVEALTEVAGSTKLVRLGNLGAIRFLLDGLFIPGSHTVEELLNAVNSAFDYEPTSLHFALRNCVRMLQFGERKPGYDNLNKELIQLDLNTALTLNPSNPIVQALSSHVHSLYLNDPAAAIEHGRFATTLAPDSAMCHSLLALGYLRAGDTSAALLHSEYGLSLGQFSRYRAFLDAVHSAVLVCTGKFSQAAKFSERSLRVAPKFAAPKKLLFLSYERSGQTEKALKTLEEIQVKEPDFGHHALQDDRTSVNIDIARNLMIESTRKYGL